MALPQFPGFPEFPGFPDFTYHAHNPHFRMAHILFLDQIWLKVGAMAGDCIPKQLKFQVLGLDGKVTDFCASSAVVPVIIH